MANIKTNDIANIILMDGYTGGIAINTYFSRWKKHMINSNLLYYHIINYILFCDYIQCLNSIYTLWIKFYKER